MKRHLKKSFSVNCERIHEFPLNAPRGRAEISRKRRSPTPRYELNCHFIFAFNSVLSRHNGTRKIELYFPTQESGIYQGVFVST